MAEELKDKDVKTIIKKKPTTDKWKKKQWYAILTPKEFNLMGIGETVATKPEQLVGRSVRISSRMLTNQIKKQHVNLVFRITDVKGNKAHTKLIGHQTSESFLKKFVRRRNSKVQVVLDAQTRDGLTLHMTTILLTARKVARPQKTALHNIITAQAREFCKQQPSEMVIQELLFGEYANFIIKDAKKVCPVKRIEVTKASLKGK
ncbi:MAG: hypothetical protein HY917_01285 [Candidatus Diapherotrites archaeon]|nr:hypothetical protein [Candidatus Diapherotrites archaeon]